jgi:hypothetical protein
VIIHQEVEALCTRLLKLEQLAAQQSNAILELADRIRDLEAAQPITPSRRPLAKMGPR